MLKQLVIFTILALSLLACSDHSNSEAVEENTSLSNEVKKTRVAEYAIVIHGGASTIKREDLTPEQDAAYRVALNAALDKHAV